MSAKKALLFDTNFIIEHSKDFETVVNKLNESYEVFITQLSVAERISQQYLELKGKYDKVQKLIPEIQSFARVDFIVKFDDACGLMEEGVQTKYSHLFQDKIIPFSRSEETYSQIIDRVYKKLPPFISGSSDKGFKDTILWLSLIDYFSKNKKFESVVFVSNDHGFTENIELLQEEFRNKTSLEIEIKNNEFLNKIVCEKQNIEINVSGLQNVTQDELNDLRQEIQRVLDSICRTYSSNSCFGGYMTIPCFKLKECLEINQIEDMFENLSNVLFRDFFATKFAFSDLFTNLYIFKDEYYISRENIESLNSLYERIKKNYKQLLPQFYKVVKETINQNFEESDFPEDIPF